jgi:hypothetical protein
MDTVLERELRDHLNRLQPGQQQRVVNFARALAEKEVRGVAGKTLIRFGGLIAQDDLARIEGAIEAGCEQVNPDEW